MSMLLAIPEKKPPKNDIFTNKFGLDLKFGELLIGQLGANL
jgi:hypothetical protein